MRQNMAAVRVAINDLWQWTAGSIAEAMEGGGRQVSYERY